MKWFTLVFTLPAFFSSPLGHSATASEIAALEGVVKNACNAPAQAGSEWSISTAADGNVNLTLKRFPSAGINGKVAFSKSEWEGVRRVLQEQQLHENKRRSDCFKDLYKVFLEKLTFDKPSSPTRPAAGGPARQAAPKTAQQPSTNQRVIGNGNVTIGNSNGNITIGTEKNEATDPD